MKTNIRIDNARIRKAMEISGVQSEDEIVQTAVSEFVERRTRHNLRDLRGEISFFDDYAYKTLRERDAL